MAGQSEEMDRNEPATAHKLEKAHQRGSIFKSADLIFAVVLLACVAVVYGLGSHVMDSIAMLFRRGLPLASRADLTQATALAVAQALAMQALMAVTTVVFSVWLAAVLIAALQAGGVFSAEPLTPDFTRLNPATGLRRIVSIKSFHDLWRSAAKLGVIIVAMAVWGQHQLGDLLHMAGLQPRPLMLASIGLLGSALTLLAGLMLVFAFLDWSFNRWDYMRQMRMSKREIKDEHKDREGDPRIKARLRELRLEWLKRARQVSKVRNADVLLTNPTHYAVALEYRHGQMPAPMITARGAGDMAQRMRAEARRRSVPVVENAPLARALFALKETQTFVPEEHFTQVARILRWVYAARGPRSAERAAA